MPRASRPRVREQRRPTFIRAWRKKEGITLEALAERIGELSGIEISDGQLSRIERGEQPYTQDLLEAVAIALRCEPADLLIREPDQPVGVEGSRAVSTKGLAPEQVVLLESMAEQMRRAG